MRLLVVGCGDLGGRVARLAAARGHEVLGARRTAGLVPDGVEPLVLDVTDPASVEIPDGLDAFVYSVAASERTDEAYRAAYPEGLRAVIDALPEPGRVRGLFISSTAVHGASDGSWVDEASDPAPTGFPGQRLLEAERLLAGARLAAASSLRLGGIYGPGRTSLLRSVEADAASLAPHVEWTNRIHVEDAARAVLHVLDLVPLPPLVEVVDEEPAPRADVLSFLASKLGRPSPPVGDTPAPRGLGKRVSSALLRRSGFDWRYPTYREGYTALISGSE